MGLLDGGLTGLVGSVFGSLLIGGTLHRFSVIDDGKGGIIASAEVDVPVRVMVEPASKVMRAANDFNERDVGLLILADGVPFPNEQDEVTVDTGPNAGRYRVMTPISVDAAAATYTMRGRLK